MNGIQIALILAGAIVLGLFLVKARGKGRTGGGEGAEPLVEAEVYMAYGRKKQAVELLEQALREEPSRTDIAAKLREIKNG